MHAGRIVTNNQFSCRTLVACLIRCRPAAQGAVCSVIEHIEDRTPERRLGTVPHKRSRAERHHNNNHQSRSESDGHRPWPFRHLADSPRRCVDVARNNGALPRSWQRTESDPGRDSQGRQRASPFLRPTCTSSRPQRSCTHGTPRLGHSIQSRVPRALWLRQGRPR